MEANQINGTRRPEPHRGNGKSSSSANSKSAARRIAEKKRQTLPKEPAPELNHLGRRVGFRLAEKAEILFERLSIREFVTSTLLAIPSASTMMLTYAGISGPMSETGATIVPKGMALSFAVTIGTFSWLGWYYLFGLLYWLRARRLGISLTAGAAFVLAVASIDAPFNMLALGGDRAVQMSLVDTTRHYERRRDSVFEKATITRRIIPAIRTQGGRFADLEQKEIGTGAHSGRRGEGKVSAAFGQIAGLLTNLAKELDIGLQSSVDLQTDIATALKEMKRHAYVPGAIRPRVQAVSGSADRLDDLLGQLKQYDYAISIRATLASLDAISPTSPATRSDFERVQNAELALIADMARPVAQALKMALEDLDKTSPPEAGLSRPLSEMDAIVTYWRPLLPQWCAALFIDMAPALLLLILIAAYREVEVTAQELEMEPTSSPSNAGGNT